MTYQENATLLKSSKPISSPLTLNDISITFHQELDTRLIRYSLIYIEDIKEYMIEFVLNINIQASFDISIELSDRITDRQYTKITSTVLYTELPLLVEGITDRKEYWDKSCKEFEVVNERVNCIEFYDLVRLLKELPVF